MKCLCQVRKTCRQRWGRIHLVDKCLLVILGILMLQSAFGLFLHEGSSQETNTIDVVIRTSAAGIFGYLISANFNQHRKRSRIAQQKQGSALVAAAAAPTAGPMAQIGFQAPADGAAAAAQPAPPTITTDPQQNSDNCDRAQILVVATVGIISLLILVVYRNLDATSTAAAAILTQFRDFVSGSVGFLISCSTSGVSGAENA